MSGEFTCNICKDQAYKPTVLLCQHVYCFACISKVAGHHCPTCRQVFIKPETYSNQLHQYFIENITEYKDIEDENDEIQKIRQNILNAVLGETINRDFSEYSVATPKQYMNFISTMFRFISFIYFCNLFKNYLYSVHIADTVANIVLFGAFYHLAKLTKNYDFYLKLLFFSVIRENTQIANFIAQPVHILCIWLDVDLRQFSQRVN